MKVIPLRARIPRTAFLVTTTRGTYRFELTLHPEGYRADCEVLDFAISYPEEAGVWNGVIEGVSFLENHFEDLEVRSIHWLVEDSPESSRKVLPFVKRP